MSSRNDGSNDTSYALTVSERKTLAEARRYTEKCENKIAEDKSNFAEKSSFGLWWDAKGIFNYSNVDDVTAHMEKYRQFYKDIDDFSKQVEKGDPKSYKKLLKLYEQLDEVEEDAKHDVENNPSSAVCRMLREFLDKKYNLDHNLKKVECIVLKQKMSEVEQTCKSSTSAIHDINEKMDKLISRKNSEMEALMETARKEKEELTAEAEKRCEQVRRESDERLKQLLKEVEERSESRIRKMKEENEELRLEAERIRRESDERLKNAVEEANRKSEARMQEIAGKNLDSLQKMMKMMENM